MSSRISEFLQQVQELLWTHQATEHSYRQLLVNLLDSFDTNTKSLNEPKRQKVGAPDIIVFDKDIPVAYLEAKKPEVTLQTELDKSNQITRYQALGNLCFTNNLEWIFYSGTQELIRIEIATIQNNVIKPLPQNFVQLEEHIKSFLTRQTITIKSSISLAQKMAEKSRLMKQIVFNTLESEEVSLDLRDQFEAFKEDLIHDLSHDEFSDIYAQTIAYGLFTARFYDPTLPTFSRDEARNLLPKSNPFLRKFFDHVAGIDIESRIVWIIDDLINMFVHVDVVEILKDFGTKTKQTDPILHFYETFLGEFDPAKRKARGVYYTPQPVVDFIVRSVDKVLKKDFNLLRGLSDNSKVTTEIPEKSKMNLRNVRVEVLGNNHKRYYTDTHKVQILDPATGTGTFPLAVIHHIAKDFAHMQGIWQSYVTSDLIPRLHGFEIMMSSYSMAHLKLAMYLKETGVTLEDHQRLDIYLTNSLEEGKDDTHNLFSSWLSNEAKEANYIKNQTPVMVIMGNPPYSGESKNKGEWIMDKMNDYKKEPGGEQKLQERNPKWLNDDYVKFIKFGQHFIDKNQEGVLAYINPHGFLDNSTFRGMRWNLLKTFDEIYILDLHGNTKKKEVAPDGSVDQNVFDIQQGVSINIFVKTGKKKTDELARVFHKDVYGKREYKYEYLDENNLSTIDFTEVKYNSPNYFFVPKDFNTQAQYDKGISINKLFPVNSVGIVTAKDSVLIDEDKNTLLDNVKNYYQKEPELNKIQKISYRPFDNRFVYYDTSIIERPREKIMKHMLNNENLGLNLCKQFKSGDTYQHAFVTNKIVESSYVSNKTSEITSLFPLYLNFHN